MFVERHMGKILAGAFDVSLTRNEDMPSKHGRRILDGARPPGSLRIYPPSTFIRAVMVRRWLWVWTG